jgi:hypothetical protein
VRSLGDQSGEDDGDDAYARGGDAGIAAQGEWPLVTALVGLRRVLVGRPRVAADDGLGCGADPSVAFLKLAMKRPKLGCGAVDLGESDAAFGLVDGERLLAAGVGAMFLGEASDAVLP